jgi:PAS domain S-box-containing protein
MLNLHPAKLSPEFQPDGRTSAEKSVEMDKLAREKGVHRFEWIHQKADGTNFPVEVTLNPIKLVDRNNVLLVVWRDLTEIKKEQEQIKMLSMVASKTANAVVITDRNGKIEWVNKSFTTISGYTFDEVMGRKPGTFLQGKDTNPDHVANIRQGLKDKLSFSQEILNYNKQGNPYWIDLSITPILDEKGEIKQYFGIETDITERKANEEAIKKQFKLLADKNKKIADSINYAKRIQEALLPRMAQIQTSLPESFVLFMPKDNISGDFYWFAEKEGIQIIIAADCTGHGVPGAFMSMLGISLLNQIVHDKEIHQPHLILDMMHAGVEEMLNQKYEEIKNRDGMDMSICVIDRIKNVVHFAGANNPMYVVSKNKLNFVSKTDGNTIKIKENNGCILTEIKGDKKSIGGRVIKKNTSSYRKQTFKIDQETHIYLFSDGFADQLGGAENLKLMGKGLKELIFKYHQLPPSEQKNAFTTFFTEWIGENKKQIDDVLLVGLKVKP